MGNLEFDSTRYEASSPMDAVPTDWYPCLVSGTEIKETKTGTGKYLMLTLDIIDGPFKNRKLFDRLNLWNRNQQAVDIANKTMTAICQSVGIIQPRNHEEFRGKRLMAKAVKTNDPQYGEGNEVKGYKAIEGASQATAAGTSAPQAEQAPAASTPPWGSR
jgi:hypothetical protein